MAIVQLGVIDMVGRVPSKLTGSFLRWLGERS